MLTGCFDSLGREVKLGDKWEYLHVVYTVVDDGGIVFRHPSKSGTFDDDIEIEHAWMGEIV